LSAENPRWIVVARVLRPRGNKGEVAVELLTDFPDRLTNLRQVFLGRTSGRLSPQDAFLGPFGAPEPQAIGVESCWLSQNHRGQGVFHFAGVHSINDAEKYRGLEILLPFAQRVELPVGQYFVAELIGCAVYAVGSETTGVLASPPCSLPEAPEFLGTVRDVQFPGEETGLRGTPVLHVDTGRGELLIPLAQDICKRVDTDARRIEVALPEGLRELNDK
jgi:16S rRNA processing protein RimM